MYVTSSELRNLAWCKNTLKSGTTKVPKIFRLVLLLSSVVDVISACLLACLLVSLPNIFLYILVLDLDQRTQSYDPTVEWYGSRLPALDLPSKALDRYPETF